MHATTLKNMQFFVGKVCSIISASMNRSFDERISREHFVVRVREVTMDGIWGTHPYNEEMVSFFAMPHVISVHQEVELDPENPDHAEMILQYEKKTGKKIKPDVGPKADFSSRRVSEGKKDLTVIEKPPVPEVIPDTGDSTFIDIASLEKLAEQTKRTFEAQTFLSRQ
jgi:hypothetical protein